MKAKKFFRSFAVLFSVVIIVAAFAVPAAYIYFNFAEISYSQQPFSETADELDNPYQGLYFIHGYRLRPEGDGDPLAELESAIRHDSEAGTRLVLVEINLAAYADSDLDDDALEQLDEILTRWTEAGKQIILRFLYDWDGNNLETEPDSFEQVLRHVEQTAPVVNRHADGVYILQGVYLGDYGEMHHSAHLSKENTKEIAEKIAELTDSSIYLAVRTPGQWETVTGLDEYPEGFPAFDGSLLSRLSLFNDGMLGSVSDLGTYFGNDLAAAREEGIAFQEMLCRSVPNGGEIVIDNPYNDFNNALADLKRMHVSYINGDYDQNVYKKWSETVIQGGVFNGTDGYYYIRQHLGYRFVMRSNSLWQSSRYDGVARFSCELENVGFASPMKKFDVKLLIENAETGARIEFPINADLRNLKSGEKMTLQTSVSLPDLEGGEYLVYLSVTDSSDGSQIRLANDLELTPDGYSLGSFELQNVRSRAKKAFG